MPSQGRPVQLAGDRNLVAGLEKRFVKASLQFAGRTYTSDELVQMLKERVAVVEAVQTAKTTLKDLLTAETAKLTATHETVAALKQFLLSTFGPTNATLADFGLAPRKRAAKPTGEALVKKAAKAKATRTARGTKGSKQKRSVSATPQAPVAASSGNGTSSGNPATHP